MILALAVVVVASTFVGALELKWTPHKARSMNEKAKEVSTAARSSAHPLRDLNEMLICNFADYEDLKLH